MENSPFLSRLNSNYAAIGDEVPHVQNIIVDSAETLESIRIEMERMRKIYMDLADRHASLLSYIEGHRALLAPARRVPVEVLLEIFHHCLPDRVEDTAIDTRQAPLLLTHICSSWRGIAIKTPTLWSSIHIVLPRHRIRTRPDVGTLITGPATTNHTLRAATTWLSRAGPRPIPLHISIRDPDTRFSSTDPLSEKILDLVLAHAERWASLMLDIPARFLDKYFVGVPAARVPMLRVLAISEAFTQWQGSSERPHRRGIPWVEAGIMQAPGLRDISMKYTALDLRRERFYHLPLDWENLTSVDLHVSDNAFLVPEVSSREWMDRLAECTSLVRCSLHSRAQRGSWVVGDNSQARRAREVILPCLEELCIEGMAEDFGPLIEALQAPALRKLLLLVIPTRAVNTRYRLAVTTFLEGYVTPQLEELAIAPVTILSETFFKVLDLLKNLRRLALLGRGWRPSLDDVVTDLHLAGGRQDAYLLDSYLFTLLSGNIGEGPRILPMKLLLPKMEEFHCNMLREGILSDATIIRFMGARRPAEDGKMKLACAPLRKVLIELNRPRDANYMDLIKRLSEAHSDGCEFAIGYLKDQL